jgi:myxalamid-type polyketide synthase MxaE and MxaD
LGRRTAAVRALEAMGIAVHTPVVDIGDEDGLRAFHDRYVAEGWPPIRGVIHAVGEFDNRLAGAMPQPAFDAVLKAKLRGAQLLDRLFPDVDLFVLFSSTGAFLPLPGQSNYAAANAGLDALAQDRRARGLHALSIGWGIWQDTGLVADAAGRANVAELARQGVQSFAADRGARLFAALGASTVSDLAVFPVDWAKFRRSRTGRMAPLFRDRLGDGGDTAASADGLREPTAAATPSERRSMLHDLVKDAVSRVLKISPKRIDSRKALGDLGLNSLMAVELRNRLEAALGRPLSATLAWNYPTVEAIVKFLAAEETDVPPASAPMTLSAGRKPVASLAEMASLTDEAAMLALLEQPGAGLR